MTEPIRVLLVDDHPLVRKGLRALLDGEAGVTVIGEAGEVPGRATGEAAQRPADDDDQQGRQQRRGTVDHAVEGARQGLEAFTDITHKFESRYLDSMVGRLPEEREVYDANPGGANEALQLTAYGAIAWEIYDTLRDAPAAVAVPEDLAALVEAEASVVLAALEVLTWMYRRVLPYRL